MFSTDFVEEQGSKNRTRRRTMCSGGPCVIASLYGDVGKQMMLAPGRAHNSSHEFVCAEYCPLAGDFVSSVQIGHVDNQSGPVTYHGAATVSQEGGRAASKAKTETCDHYQWSEMLFHVVPIQTTDFYVYRERKGNEPPVPFFSSMSVLKGVAPVSFNSSFLSFQTANLTGRFDIDPASFATCPLSPGCSGDRSGLLNRFGARENGRVRGGPSSSFLRRQPSFSSVPHSSDGSHASALEWRDYSCRESTAMLENSGGVFRGKANDVCCTPSSTTTVNGECMVTRAAKRGMHYVDYTHQRDRYEDEISGQTRVVLYGKILKDMLINVTDGKETCQEFCPLLDGETLRPLMLGANSTDQGPAVVDNRDVEHYRWNQYDEIPVTHQRVKMAQVEFFVSKTAAKHAATPVFSLTRIMPYGGAQIGSQNTTFTEWVSGVPPASKFDIAGVKDCPQAKNCQIEQNAGVNK
jgi:hypothetical protein